MQEILDDYFLEENPKNERRTRWFYICLILLVLGSIIATIVAWYEVGTIVSSGPIVSIIGGVFSLLAYRTENKLSIFLGLLPFVTSLFWLIVIFVKELSPKDCEFIVPTSLSIVTAFLFVMGLYILIQRKN